MIFERLAELAKQAGGTVNLAITRREGTEQLTVVVMPKPDAGKNAEPALATPLILHATAAELDAEFIDALSTYCAGRKSLQEQVAATAEVLAAAQEAQVQKGAKAATKVAAKPAAKPSPTATANEDAEGDDVDDGEGGEGDDDSVPPAAAQVGPQKPAATATGGGMPSLFT